MLSSSTCFDFEIMVEDDKKQKTIVIGAGPVGALAALYAAQRGHEVEIYELRSGKLFSSFGLCCVAKSRELSDPNVC